MQPILDSVMPMGVSSVPLERGGRERTEKTKPAKLTPFVSSLLSSFINYQANSQPQGLAVAPWEQMHMNIGVLNNPVSGSVYAPVGEHVGM